MLGAHFHKEIDKNFYLNIGAKYGFNSELSAEKEINSYLQVAKFGTTYTDHIVDTTYKTSEIPLPSSFSIGTSAILYQKLELGFDYQIDNWSKSSFGEQIFADNQRYSFGLEFVPDFGSSVYWKLVRYRAGFNYTKSYIMYNNSQLKQITGSFGMGFPLRSGALINVGLLYSHREIPNTDFFTENYLQLNLNFSFKANWFVKKHFY
jgi:hypothetical protein